MAVVYIVTDDHRIIHGVYSNRKSADNHQKALERQGKIAKVTRHVPAVRF